MLDTAREGCFLVGAIVCIKRKVFLVQTSIYKYTLHLSILFWAAAIWASGLLTLTEEWLEEALDVRERTDPWTTTQKKQNRFDFFLHFQSSISFINHQRPEHREVHVTTLKRCMYRIYKFKIYPRLNPCPWRNRSEPCPCCVGAPTATACCPGEKLRTAPAKRLESGCCWTESFLEVHQQGWVLHRRRRRWCSECSNWSTKK